MNIEQTHPTKNGKSRPGPRMLEKRPFRLSVVAEDLRAPIDEGLKKVYFNIIQTLMKKGADVSVYTRFQNPLLEGTFPLPGNRLLFGNQFRRDLRSQSPDAALYMPSAAGTAGALVRAAMIKAQSAGIPLALLHLQYRDLPKIARHLRLHRSVDFVFAQSQASAEVYRSFGCKTVLLRGGVDNTTFRPVCEEEKRLLRSQHGFQADEKIVLHVGHINPNRNVIALTRLAAAGYRVILVASTSTRIDPDLLLALRQAGVQVVTDFVANIQFYYQMADCYLFPLFQALSAIDAPLSVLEAMACNLPVVTTRFGALPNMFKPGHGLHFVDSDMEILPTIKEAVGEKDIRTVEMVSPYTWDCAAATIYETLKGAAR